MNLEACLSRRALGRLYSILSYCSNRPVYAHCRFLNAWRAAPQFKLVLAVTNRAGNRSRIRLHFRSIVDRPADLGHSGAAKTVSLYLAAPF